MQLPRWQISLARSPRIQHCGRDLRGVTTDASWTENHFSIHWVLLFFHNAMELVIDDWWLKVPPNSAVVVPPHSHLTLRFLDRSVHHWFHFSCASGRGDEVPIPALSRVPNAAGVKKEFANILALYANDRIAASERFAGVLQRLVLRNETPEISTRPMHPKLQIALRVIESNLHRPIYAPEIARQAGLSQRQLLNLIRELTGRSIVGFIRQRRGERARHLMISTPRQIQSIAIEVGLPDLQSFNKTIRQLYGKSPRQLRKSAGVPVL